MSSHIRQLLLDTETTGFEAKEGHRIIEFAALEMINRELTGRRLHLYFNPERDIPIEATNVHGITLDQVADEAPFRERVDEIIEFITGAELIIHNAKFDIGFLDHHFLELGKEKTLSYATASIDTLTIARGKFPGGRNSLDALCDRFEIDKSNRNYHGALIDCDLLFHVYIALTREQISLLGDEDKLNGQKFIYEKIDVSKYQLPNVQISDEEHAAHIAYLKQLDKISKGNSSWYNATKDFING
ncbi:MAG: DNA polymerase III subunit epsilon [Burkholderiales bacterium]|nr:DNA polymerase III subunit epsilon [Burkholderiales bacterium]